MGEQFALQPGFHRLAVFPPHNSHFVGAPQNVGVGRLRHPAALPQQHGVQGGDGFGVFGHPGRNFYTGDVGLTVGGGGVEVEEVQGEFAGVIGAGLGGKGENGRALAGLEQAGKEGCVVHPVEFGFAPQDVVDAVFGGRVVVGG